MSQRLTRKSIKHDIREDTFRTSIDRSVDFVTGHGRMLLMALAGVLVLVAAGFGVHYWMQQREARASQLLGQASKIAEAPVQQTGATPNDAENPSFATEKARQEAAEPLFQQIRQKYPNTGAGAIAAVYLGRYQLEQGNTEAARKLWQQFLDDHPDHMLASSVRLSLLALDRQAGKGEQVAKELRAMLEKPEKTLPEDVLLFQLGQTLEDLGKTDEAKATYQRLGDEFPQSPYAQQAQSKVRDLGGPAEPAQVG